MFSNSLLIVEDEEKIAYLLEDYFKPEGYQTRVLLDGTYAVETVLEYQPDFVILDRMLPGKDGLTICKEIRQFSQVPIMMLTARVDEVDRLLGLELGADDYVCKPFLPREVVARVKTILRRVSQTAPKDDTSPELMYRGIQLIPSLHRCQVNHQEVELTPVEFRLLQTLLSHPGRVYSRDNLITHCYPDERIVCDRTIDSHVKNLRKKLADGNTENLIHTIYGVGYKIE